MFANYDKETYKRIGKTEYEEFFVTKIGEEYIYIEVPHRQGGRWVWAEDYKDSHPNNRQEYFDSLDRTEIYPFIGKRK